jgi:hypothetical protein
MFKFTFNHAWNGCDISCVKFVQCELSVAVGVYRKDCDTLRNTVKRTQIAQEQAAEDAEVRYSITVTDQDDISGGPNSAEWVEVENPQSSGKTERGGSDAREPVVTAVPVVEVELRRRVDKLSATVAEVNC